MMHVSILSTLAEFEGALAAGLDGEWRTLAAADPFASAFQDVPWCTCWYRAYASRFEPRIIIGREAGSLVAVAALAVSLTDGTLQWAGGAMADYRDVLATPAMREAAVQAVVRHFVDGGYPAPFWWGYTNPDSPSVPFLTRSAKPLGIRGRTLTHPCYRTIFSGDGTAAKFVKKESVRRHVAYFRRQGEVACVRMQSRSEWLAHRELFFEHHTLRQLFADRPVSFFDDAKQAMYDALFAEYPHEIAMHVLRVGDRVIGEHVGLVWHGVAYFGAPAFDVAEHRRSPGQILLAMLLGDWERVGLRGVDLTIGESSYKQRFGNELVSLPSMEIYRPGATWLAAAGRRRLVDAAKRYLVRRGGTESWERARARLFGFAHRLRGRPTDPDVAAFLNEIALRRAGAAPVSVSRLEVIEPSADTSRIAASEPSNDLGPIARWRATDAIRGAVVRAVVGELDAGSKWISMLGTDGSPRAWALVQVTQAAPEIPARLLVYGVTILDSTDALALVGALTEAARRAGQRVGASEAWMVSYCSSPVARSNLAALDVADSDVPAWIRSRDSEPESDVVAGAAM